MTPAGASRAAITGGGRRPPPRCIPNRVASPHPLAWIDHEGMFRKPRVAPGVFVDALVHAPEATYVRLISERGEILTAEWGEKDVAVLLLQEDLLQEVIANPGRWKPGARATLEREIAERRARLGG